MLVTAKYLYSENIKIKIGNQIINAELANTPQKRERGLMFREKLAENEGMLFVFGTEGYHSFWMKNTLIPLDIIWINAEKEIVDIKENFQPCKVGPCESYVPKYPAKYVLEANAGWIKENQLKLGDKTEF